MSDLPENQESAGRILVVDDKQINRDLLEEELEDAGFEVRLASSGEECLVLARRWRPECIILDVRMPGMDGIETCRKLRDEAETAGIPVVFLTGHQANEETAVRALEVGGNDFLSKPYSPQVLYARVSSQVRLARIQNRLRRLVITDELTGLYSRRYLFETLRKQVKMCQRKQTSDLSCLMIDIDHFKKVNDERGHLEGDRILKWVAETLQHCVRGSDVVARFGGEEFAVIMPSTSPEGAKVLAEKIREKIEVEGAGEEVSITVSIGIAAVSPDRDNDADTDRVMTSLVRAADQALYVAKRAGRNRVSNNDDSDSNPGT